MNEPRISIVTPSFNQGAFLEETIQSVLSQDYPNLEYFVMDGGSTDGSVEMIRRYENRLAGWVSEPDAGQTDAINKGFVRSTGRSSPGSTAMTSTPPAPWTPWSVPFRSSRIWEWYTEEPSCSANRFVPVPTHSVRRPRIGRDIWPERWCSLRRSFTGGYSRMAGSIRRSTT